MENDIVSAVSSSNSPGFGVPLLATSGQSLREHSQVKPSAHGKGWKIDSFRSDFVELQRINDRLNAVAKIQRTFEKRFEKLNDYVEKMKAQLERILKQFPPFPPGSEERVRALRSYAYFRKMIDQLTVPPPDESPVPEAAVRSGSKTEGIQVLSFHADISIQAFEIQITS